MAETLTNLVTRIRERFPDCTSTIALRFLNNELRDLCHDLPIYRSNSTITLTADTATYSIPYGVVKIEQVFYETSSTERVELSYVPYDEYTQDDGYFRYQDSGTPTRYWLGSGDATPSEGGIVIGFDPPPDTSTSGTYPRIKYYYTEMPSSDLSGADESPDIFSSPDVLIFGACFRYAVHTGNTEEAKLFLELHRSEKERQYAAILGRMRYASPKLTSNSYRRRRDKV